MREDQPKGLPPAACAFLSEYEIQPACCSECKRPYPLPLKVIGSYEGFNDHNLYQYQLQDGRTADEYLQATPWSSGPMFFLGLKVSDGTILAWTEEEIEEFI